MAYRWRNGCWKLGLASSLAIGGALAELSVGIATSRDCAFAQIKPDATLGAERSVIKSNVNIKSLSSDQIDGGAQRGANLFHSFREFNVNEGRGAYFSNPAGIENILGRVTGKNSSNIQGTLGVLGNANLFLMNPNGIIFGPNSSLDVNGSFLASTASSLDFADGIEFSATNPQAPPLLRVNVPIGLQFGTNPGRILVRGSGHNLSYSNTGSTIGTDSPGLQVQPSETLALVGGDVVLEGGNLRAESGRIELGSVAESSLVSLTPMDSGFALGYSGVQNFGDIQLSKQASADISGEGGGEIQVQGSRLSVSDGSAILSITQGSKSGGSLTVNASDSVELIGESADGQYASSLDIETQGTGASGDLKIATGKLIATDGAYVQNYTFAGGNGGNLTVQASESIEFIGAGLYGSGLYTGATSTGNAGNLTIETGSLSIADGGQINANTYGQGNAGSVNIFANDQIIMGEGNGSGYILNSVNSAEAVGSSGGITISTGSLFVKNASQIRSQTLGRGNAGNIKIVARDTISFDGRDSTDTFPSAAFTSVEPTGKGNGGNIYITTGSLSITNRAQLLSNTEGKGNAGNVFIEARDQVSLINSIIISEVTTETGVGKGGDINISTGSLLLKDASALLADLENRGSAGNITIQARDRVVLEGEGLSAFSNSNEIVGSQITATVEPQAVGDGGNIDISTKLLSVTDDGFIRPSTFGQGDAGNLSITIENLSLANGALLSANTFGPGKAGNLTIVAERLEVRDKAEVNVRSAGAGAAGNLIISADFIGLDNQAALNANTTAGQGDIILNSQGLLLRRGSNITTNAQGTATGGNITIDTGVMAALENSNITADAIEGPGGQVKIDAQGIFGTEFREEETPQSDITATSELGPQFSGTVELNTPDVDPSQGLVALPEEVVDASGLVAQGCEGPSASRFTVTGRGGLPPNPDETPIADDVLTGLVTLDSSSKTRSNSVSSTPSSRKTPAALVEARGWVVNNQGQVTLTAQAPTPGACDTP